MENTQDGELEAAHFFRRSVDENIEFVLRNAKFYLEQFPGGASYLKNRTVLEVGPGKDLGILLVFAGFGARIFAMDRYFKEWDADFHPFFYHHLCSAVANEFTGISIAPIQEIIRNQRHSNDSVVLLRCALENAGEIETASVDVTTSIAVLEHTFDFQKACAQLGRVTKVGGFGFHQIDFRDHNDNVNHPLEHLTVSDEEYWRKPIDECCATGNRARSSEFAKAFTEAGFEFKFSPDIYTDDKYLDEIIPRLDRRFQKCTREDLKILSGRFDMRKISS